MRKTSFIIVILVFLIRMQVQDDRPLGFCSDQSVICIVHPCVRINTDCRDERNRIALNHLCFDAIDPVNVQEPNEIFCFVDDR